MTRRVLVYEDNGKFYISQEFNGDKKEALSWNKNTFLKVNWEEIIPLFDGITTLTKFRKAVRKSEKAYGYETYPLITSEEIPIREEVWKVIDGKLTLYARYDEIIFEK